MNNPLKITIILLCLFAKQSIAKDVLLVSKNNPGDISATVFNDTAGVKGLLVTLPGCGQNADEFADSSGLKQLATQQNLTLLKIQQHKTNNIQSCFNWFSPSDSRVGQGEMASIENVIKLYSQGKPVYLVRLLAAVGYRSKLNNQRLVPT
jgi:hypothetical protein